MATDHVTHRLNVCGAVKHPTSGDIGLADAASLQIPAEGDEVTIQPVKGDTVPEADETFSVGLTVK